jgi:hydrogenase-4 component E
MNGAIVWLVVALGLGVLTLRRRSVAVAAVSLQALLLTGAAAAQAHGANDAIATAALGVRALLLGALLFLVIGRTRESRPVRADSGPLTRGAAGIGVAFALAWLVPTLGLGDRNAERAVLALVAFGLVAAATRRASRSSRSCRSTTRSRSPRSPARPACRHSSSSASRAT